MLVNQLFLPEKIHLFIVVFFKYQAEVVKYHMRKDFRESVGLGSPPSIFTTNGSESINAAIKRKVNHKESEWPQFNNHVKQLVTSQHEEMIRALSQRGQYRVKPEYAHYGVTTQKWVKMRPEQRQAVVAAFEKASLKCYSSYRKVEFATNLSHISRVSNDDDHGDGLNHEQQCSSSNNQHLGIDSIELHTDLSISAEDSGITTIPLVTLNAIWAKAFDILRADNAITPAPGSNRKACMVISYSQVAPHLVQCKSDGQYVCGNNCQQWASSQICSHVLAAAECNNELHSFLEWYTMCAKDPNISTLALSGLPHGRGRKGGRAKRQRSRNSHSPIDNVTSRPGMQLSFFNNVGVAYGAVVNVSSATGMVDFQSNEVGCFTELPASGPPPLIRLPMSTQAGSMFTSETNCSSPFFLKALTGNIRICQGCRRSLRLPNGLVPQPPFDLVIARMERRSFYDATGAVRVPTRPSAAHYHLKLACIKAVDPHFVLSTQLQVPPDITIKLTMKHRQYFAAEFGINI